MDTTLDNWLALFNGQTRYRLEISDSILKPDVLNFHGREVLNTPFKWRIEFTTPQKGITREDAMLKYATLSMLSGRVVQGIITGFEVLKETVDQTHFAVTLSSRMALLAHTRRCAVWQNVSVPELVEQVLRSHGLEGADFEFRLERTYPVRELITQWRETDLQFIQRILAEDGIWFRTGVNTTTGLDTVTFADSQLQYQFDVRLPYREPSALHDGAVEAVWDARVWHHTVTGSVATRDYNYRTASTPMDATAASTRDFAGGPDEETSESAVKWVYVAQPEQQPNIEVLSTMPAPVKKWKSFAAGMCTMLVVSVAAVWGWQHFHQPVPLQTQLTASLVPFPAPLTSEQLDMSRQQAPLPQVLITQTQQQLARLDKLPPDWNIDYSRQLLEQVRVLWQEQAKPLIQHWQQQLNAAALPAEQLNGWSQGMATLQKLSDRLNELDGQKGKYMTVSELKSVVFSAIQSFNQSIPAEEQLRVLSQNPADEPLPAAARAQLEMHLKQLIARYAEIKQDALK
ncbi:type VI secretion system tip protein VgrG [Pantoea agglomerans]|uniref:type VI secretion system tip protein VgrG n=1 Tax=Enterobacter agglomerans TaxID=549 RepID=UPI003C7A6F09